MAEDARPERLSDVDRQAFATATGVLAAVYIALSMGLDQPYWAALSVMMIANTDRDALVTKGILRVLSTLVGVSVGFIVAQWMEGLPIQQALLVGASAAIGTYGKQRSAYSYAWFYGGLTFMLVMLFSMVQPQDLYSFAHYRCYEIVIGVVCGMLASWALGPNAGELHARLKAQTVAVSPENALRQALIAGFGAIVIVVVWSQFNLPQLPQVLISSLIVVDTDPNASRHKGWQRIIGCGVGGVAGLLVIGLDATDQIWWATMLFVGIFSFARVHLSKTPSAYIGTQSAIAFIITLVDPGPPTSLFPPVDRLVGIIIGVSIMTALVWALNPPAKADTAAGNPA